MSRALSVADFLAVFLIGCVAIRLSVSVLIATVQVLLWSVDGDLWLLANSLAGAAWLMLFGWMLLQVHRKH